MTPDEPDKYQTLEDIRPPDVDGKTWGRWLVAAWEQQCEREQAAENLPADEQAIRDRCKMATPEPWETDGTGVPLGIFCTMLGFGPKMCGLDIEFIAHAREDVPALLDLVRDLRMSLRNCGYYAEQALDSHVSVYRDHLLEKIKTEAAEAGGE